MAADSVWILSRAENRLEDDNFAFNRLIPCEGPL